MFVLTSLRSRHLSTNLWLTALVVVLVVTLTSGCSLFNKKKGKKAKKNKAQTEQVAADSQGETQPVNSTKPLPQPSTLAMPGQPLPSGASQIQPKHTVKAGQGEDFGVITIHRHGPGYDISLSLDAGDENVSFAMDLPKQGESELASVAQQLQAMDQGQPEDRTQPPATSSDTTQSRQATSVNQLATLSERDKSANDHIVVAQQMFYRRDYLGALDQTLMAIQKQPDFALAYALKGSLYYKMGRLEEARTAWEQALKIDPNMTDVKNSLDILF